MSPSYFYGSIAYVFRVFGYGSLDGWGVYDSNGVRPVINLKSAIAITGSGTTSDPYVVAS